MEKLKQELGCQMYMDYVIMLGRISDTGFSRFLGKSLAENGIMKGALKGINWLTK